MKRQRLPGKISAFKANARVRLEPATFATTFRTMRRSIAATLAAARLRRLTAASLLSVACFVLLAQTGGHAATVLDALPYAKGFLLTGGYVTGTVDLTEQNNPIDQNGFSEGTISISGVPADADIVAAYLYWETITLASDLSQAAGVTFRGEEVLLNDVMAVKKSSQALIDSTASCWSSGVPLTMTLFRADVLRWLPIRLDANDKPTGKRLVNDADLTAHTLPLHKVKLPARQGNQIPESAGASLIVVYRDPSKPLSKIVFYDGIHIQGDLNEVTTQSLRGFYKSSATKSAQITHIIGSGQPNGNERIFFDDGPAPPPGSKQIASNPVAGGTASQRGWSTLTYNVSNRMNPGNNSAGGYGETATTTVDHTPGGSYECLTWGAVIFSTAVADADPGDPNITNGRPGDGLPDGLEEAQGGLMDPDGQALPNLYAMGARSNQRDIFIEFNALWAQAGTNYGSPAAPYSSTTTTKTDPNGHNHMPTPEVLKKIGDKYLAHGITPHFDVGEWAANTGYHAPNNPYDPQKFGVVQHVDWVDDYTSSVADTYLVPSAYARGGEVAKERACDPASSTCLFPDFPGTVGWKLGLQLYRDEQVGNDGEEISLDPADPDYFDWLSSTSTHRRRFDRNRFGLFHYVLNAHARGKAKAEPCLINGVPGPYPNNGTSCTSNDPDVIVTDNQDPNVHVPLSSSGVADLPGGNVLVTLGLWDDFVGRPFVRAATTFHEIGHNLDLWHGGLPATWGNKHPAPPLPPTPTASYIEPNCKPNYVSSMSYLFQVHGLFDDLDNIHLDYSGKVHNNLNETGTLSDGALSPGPSYRSAWFAPANSALAIELGVSAATRYCNGVKFDPNPNPSMGRVYTILITDSIDWNGDKTLNSVSTADVNLDGGLSSALYGFDDWAGIRLDQISAGRKTRQFQDEDLTNDGSGDWIDVGGGTGFFDDYGSGDWIDVGGGDWIDVGGGVFRNSDGDWIDVGGGVVHFAEGDWIDVGGGDWIDVGGGDWIDVGGGDWIDVGGGDWIDVGGGTPASSLARAERQELNFDDAKGLGVPYALSACIIGRDAAPCTSANPSTSQYHRNEVRWTPSTAGHIFQYLIQRKRGNAAYAQVGTSPTASFIDAELPGISSIFPSGVEFTYRVKAEFDDETIHTLSPWSQPVTITAVNGAPTANANSYTAIKGTPLNVAAPGVLGNDTDVDSPTAYIGRRAVLVGPGTPVANPDGSFTTATAHGVVVLRANGSFTYTPASGYDGPDSFTYKADDGFWSGDPTVPLSGFSSSNATVSITVKKK